MKHDITKLHKCPLLSPIEKAFSSYIIDTNFPFDISSSNADIMIYKEPIPFLCQEIAMSSVIKCDIEGAFYTFVFDFIRCKEEVKDGEYSKGDFMAVAVKALESKGENSPARLIEDSICFAQFSLYPYNQSAVIDAIKNPKALPDCIPEIVTDRGVVH